MSLRRFSHRLPRALAVAALGGVLLGAGSLVALADPPRAGYSPDPAAKANAKHWVFQVTSQNGKLTLDGARPVTLAKPEETARVQGRWALELYVGKELLDRVRFNVPLMGDEPAIKNRNRMSRPDFQKNVNVQLTAQMADNPRAVYLLLVDRETGDTQKLEWPPLGDGHLTPWRTAVSDGGADFAEGGTRIYSIDGGFVPGRAAPEDAGIGLDAGAPPRDAGHD